MTTVKRRKLDEESDHLGAKEKMENGEEKEPFINGSLKTSPEDEGSSMTRPGDHLKLLSPNFSSINPLGSNLSIDNEILLSEQAEKRHALTFDEVTLADNPVDFRPDEVSLETHISKHIRLSGGGIMSAAMDMVTEKELALAMAKMGGIGILHRNISPQEQALQLKWVRLKIHFGGMVDKPITFPPQMKFSRFQKESKTWPFTSFPIVDDDNTMLGLITRDQIEFIEDTNPTLSEVMIPIDKLVTCNSKTTGVEAYAIMSKQKVKKLPVLDGDGILKGLYVWNDVKNDHRKRTRFSLDEDGHFLVGAAIGVGSEGLHRAQLLFEAGCKLMVIDSSHGACKAVKDTIIALRKNFGSSVDIVAGNIASYASAQYLMDGTSIPDALKVGIGPGSICTTRQVTGHGVPQVTAIFEVWRAVRDFGKSTGNYIPIIADGGIRTSGDIVKCFAVGASAVMLGSVLAGTEESPGKLVEKGGRTFKTIRGMGSRGAMNDRKGSRDRYICQSQKHTSNVLTTAQAEKIVPEGVEGLVQCKGTVEHVMTQLLGGIQAGLAHSGGKDINSFRLKAKIWYQSFAGVVEGKPHNITDVTD